MDKIDIHRLFHFFNAIFSPEIAHTFSHKKLTKPEFCLVALLNVAWHLFIVCSPFCYPFYPFLSFMDPWVTRQGQDQTKWNHHLWCLVWLLYQSHTCVLLHILRALLLLKKVHVFFICWRCFLPKHWILQADINCWLVSYHSSTSYTTLPTGCNRWWIKS